MERLYLKVIDGKAVTHPVLESNLLIIENVMLAQNNNWTIPANWYKYELVIPPTPTPYQKNLQPNYILKEGTTDVYTVEWVYDEMTAEEKAEVKATSEKPYNSWLWDDINGGYHAPISYPNDGKIYIWDELVGNWQYVTAQQDPTNTEKVND